MLWPLFVIRLGLLLNFYWLSWDVLFMGMISSIALITIALGCGFQYRSRCINPASRTMVNVGNGHYFERIGPDESDYP
jgi:hypothetical protein